MFLCRMDIQGGRKIIYGFDRNIIIDFNFCAKWENDAH